MRAAGVITVGVLVLATVAAVRLGTTSVEPVPAVTPAPEVVTQAAQSNRDRDDDDRRRRRYREPPVEPMLASWIPGSPLTIGLQAGHWKALEAPDELSGIRYNGTNGGGKAEWEVNLEIANLTAELLRAAGHEVQVLPATVPQRYRAHLFISIHADGHNDASVSGYRVAASRRDRTGHADPFAELLTRTYGDATGLRLIPDVTRRMSSYYAFNNRRYDHAVDPATAGVLIETGFLTSPGDREVIVAAQHRSAQGIADAVIQYVQRLAAHAELMAAVAVD